eukprot:g65697.t1
MDLKICLSGVADWTVDCAPSWRGGLDCGLCAFMSADDGSSSKGYTSMEVPDNGTDKLADETLTVDMTRTGGAAAMESAIEQSSNEVVWLYAIRMASFTPEDGAEEEVRLQSVMDQFRFGLQQKTGLPSDDNVKFVSGDVKGKDKEPDAFIKVGATLEQIRIFAEQQKLQLRCKSEYFEKTGQYCLPYSRELQAQNVFQHPSMFGSDNPNDDTFDCLTGAAPGHQCQCAIITPAQAELLMQKVLKDVFDDVYDKPLGFGIKEGLAKKEVVDFYPLHMSTRLRKSFLLSYLGWWRMWFAPWLWTRSSKRFIRYLRGYFGEKVALYFSFLHFYTTALVFLAVPGAIAAIYQYDTGIDSVLVPFYSIFAAIWGVLFLQFWLRKQAAFAHRWGMTDYMDHEEPIHYTFNESTSEKEQVGYYNNADWVGLDKYSEYKNSRKEQDIMETVRLRHMKQEEQNEICDELLDEIKYKEFIPNTKRLHQSWLLSICKMTFTNSVLATLAMGVVAVTVSLLFFRIFIQRVDQFWGSVAAGCANAIVIAILDFFYNFLAVRLNDWERHRTPTEYENALIIKVFFFQFVNAYCSLFYIAFFKGHVSFFGLEDSCKDRFGNDSDDCMFELAAQVQSILITRIFLGNLTEVFVPWLMGRLKMLKHTGSYALKGKDAVVQENILPNYHGERVSGTFADYAELAIQYGYVALFAPAFPLGAVVALASNVLENATDALKLLTTIRKPVYRGAKDIGPWFGVFTFLSMVAVITNSLILGFTSSQLNSIFGASTSTKWLVVLIIEHCVLALQFFIAEIVADTPAWVRIEQSRQEEIMRLEKNISNTLLQEIRQKLEQRNPPSPVKSPPVGRAKTLQPLERKATELQAGDFEPSPVKQKSERKTGTAERDPDWLNKLGFHHGQQVELQSAATGLAVRAFVDNGALRLDASGSKGDESAKWTVSVEDAEDGLIRLHRIGLDTASPDRERYLRIDREGNLSGRGARGRWTLLRVVECGEKGGQGFALQSVELPTAFVAFAEDGSVQSPCQGGAESEACRFRLL